MRCPHCNKPIEDKWKRHRLKRYLRGICQRCSNPRLENRTCCRKCIDKQTAYVRRRRDDKKEKWQPHIL